MEPFDHSIAETIVETCQSERQELGKTLSTALEKTIEVAIGEVSLLDRAGVPAELVGPGLALALKINETGALILFPEAGGLLPDWYRQPDAAQESRLSTLAQEWGVNLLPLQFMPDDFRAADSADLSQTLELCEPVEPTGLLPLKLTGEGVEATAFLLWPVARPLAIAASAGDTPTASSSAASETAAPPQATSVSPPPRATKPASPPPPVEASSGRPPLGDDFGVCAKKLPLYGQSLLKIRIPVVVTLAAKKQSIDGIIELSPGTIIQFDKSCDELLELEVANRKIAVGEAVKVGDKFGLKITSMVLPEERFQPAGKPSAKTPPIRQLQNA